MARAFSLPDAARIVGQCRVDPMIVGPIGNQNSPSFAVVITPAAGVGPNFSYVLPPEVEDRFRDTANELRRVMQDDR